MSRRESSREGYVAAQAVLLLGIALGPWRRRAPASSLTLKGAGTLLIVTGAASGIWGGRSLGQNLTPSPEPRAEATLTETGAYRYARHPIYGGLLLSGLGRSLYRRDTPALLLTAALGGLLTAKIGREEAALTQRFPGYPAYRRRARQFIPGLW